MAYVPFGSIPFCALAYGLQNNVLGCECSNNPIPDEGVESMNRKNGQDCKKRKNKTQNPENGKCRYNGDQGQKSFPEFKTIFTNS